MKGCGTAEEKGCCNRKVCAAAKRCNCDDQVSLWDCLFGEDRWSDRSKKRRQVMEERRQKETACKKISCTDRGIKKPPAVAPAEAPRRKRVSHKKIYSLEIEPGEFLKFLCCDGTGRRKKDASGMRSDVRLSPMSSRKKIIDESKELAKQPVNSYNYRPSDVNVSFMINRNSSSSLTQPSTSKLDVGKRSVVNEKVFNSTVASKLEAQIMGLVMKVEDLEHKMKILHDCRILPGSDEEDEYGNGPGAKCEGTKEKQTEMPASSSKEFTIQRSDSDPNVLRIQPPLKRKCSALRADTADCVTIHPKEGTFCVHGNTLSVPPMRDETDLSLLQKLWQKVKEVAYMMVADDEDDCDTRMDGGQGHRSCTCDTGHSNRSSESVSKMDSTGFIPTGQYDENPNKTGSHVVVSHCQQKTTTKTSHVYTVQLPDDIALLNRGDASAKDLKNRINTGKQVDDLDEEDGRRRKYALVIASSDDIKDLEEILSDNVKLRKAIDNIIYNAEHNVSRDGNNKKFSTVTDYLCRPFAWFSSY